MKPIRFKFAPAKALAALHWIVSEQPGIDLHAVLKACYFADKSHLNAFGRPIFGATYKAMKFGPVPLEIYEMLKSEPLWLAELGIEGVPWRLDGYRLRLTGNQTPDASALSESNMEHLEEALRKSRTMTFNERTAATHGPDWQRANLGTMRYEDMLDETEYRETLAEDLRETAHLMRM